MGDKTSFMDAYNNVEEGIKNGVRKKVDKFNNAKTGVNYVATFAKVALHTAVFGITETTTITSAIVVDTFRHLKGVYRVMKGDKYGWKKR